MKILKKTIVLEECSLALACLARRTQTQTVCRAEGALTQMRRDLLAQDEKRIACEDVLAQISAWKSLAEDGPDRLWVLDRLPANRLEAAGIAFLAMALEYPLPQGCQLSLSTKNDGHGGIGLHIKVDDPDGMLYAAGTAPSASAFPGPEDAGGGVEATLLAFAGMLERAGGRTAPDGRRDEGTFGWTPPPRMQAFCAGILRRTAEAIRHRLPAQAGEDGAPKL